MYAPIGGSVRKVVLLDFELAAGLIGFALGVLLAAAAAWLLLRRHVARVRSAERRARQAERMAEIGAMTGGLAHEIKNPLSTIGLNAQLLIEGLTDAEMVEADRSRLQNRGRALQRETERLRGILQDFLEFAGQIQLDRRLVDLNEIVRELADFYHPEAERHRVVVKLELAAQPVMAEVDSRVIKQAILNLMINATQAMHGATQVGIQGVGQGAGGGGGAGGAERESTLTLRTTVQREKLARQDRIAMATVHVVDTGPGIPPATLKEIFKPYFTTKSGGSGLGLPTTRRLIEEHGGQVGVHSEEGKGSDFFLTVPLKAESRV